MTLPSPATKLLVLLALLGVALGAAYGIVVSMPGESFTGTPPPLDAAQAETARRLALHVATLATDIGPRHDRTPGALSAAAAHVATSFAELGDEVTSLPFEVDGHVVANLEVLRRGSDPAADCLVIGAHLDTVETTPGADDNASGVATLLELARLLRGRPLRHDLRLVSFVNEEPPHFRRESMGSRVYARGLAARGVAVRSMLSLESLGYYAREPGSQAYPFPFDLCYPETGDFLAFVGDLSSRALVRRLVASFREHAAVPSQGVAAPGSIPGIGWSDHASFWELGVPAVMLTDTAPFRNPHYHRPTDTADTLDLDTLARVVHALAEVVMALDQEAE